MKIYINEQDKKEIKKRCELRLKGGQTIRAALITLRLKEKYCVGEVLEYIKNELKIPLDKIWRGETANYMWTLPRGHIQFSSQDVFFKNKYYHQYVIAKELDLEMAEVEKYVIHHIDENKSNNDIENLFIFYDTASHIAFHQAKKHDENIDINVFNEDYIDKLLSKCGNNNAEDIKRYLQVLDKKNNLSNPH